jgi:Domain of unknown function (DUF4920)
MKLQLLAPLTLCLAAACCASAPSEAALPTGQLIGQEMEAATIYQFSVVDETPAEFFDRTVLVEAEIKAVCAKAGCWMQVEDDDATSLVRWETGCGGAFKFPMEGIGKRVLIQGSFYAKELGPEERAHMQEEAGTDVEFRPDPYEFNASAVLILEEQ